ncbi:TetR/AcrR family transcriptional regulator [Leucobacter tenebrionis]|uniref:TetR/AcrR family transcriptional regulator n=1 Tax=Leucobacter tenebrionis TaxID=2873270 RepID=UPI001CA74499|nr:TetR family transcriptional regulator [Leucobacter tenebrionis]QZY52139.1 TetR family transcriptional regulator [Leucobacter tenebrionis]
MPGTQATAREPLRGGPARPKRADALRNIEAIIDAATRLLAMNPEASMNEIAKEAGVGRITLYGHFESRAALLREVADRAIAHSEQELALVDVGGDPRDALGRLLEASWALTHRYGALVIAASQALSPEQLRRAHDEPFARARALLERGREAGEFRDGVSIDWQLSLAQAILHGASAAVHRGDISADEAPALVRDAVLATLTR